MEITSVFRLCHMCSQLNEAKDEVLKCTSCGKSFLSMFYFESLRLQAESTAGVAQNRALLQQQSSFDKVSVQGLIVIW